MRRLMGVVTVVAVVTGCGSEVTEPDVLADLLGAWVWLDASGGIAGTTRSPASEGYGLTLHFSDTGGVELLRDGVTQVRTGFTYFDGHDGDSDGTLRYDEPLFGFESSVFELISGDTLLLIDPCCDGFVRRWVRP
jgi:hypothetical protein